MNKNNLLIKLSITTLLLTILIFSGCKEDTVEPKNSNDFYSKELTFTNAYSTGYE